MTAQDVQQLAANAGLKGTIYNNVGEAYEAARQNAIGRDFIYIGGSMYVLAELLTGMDYDDHLDN